MRAVCCFRVFGAFFLLFFAGGLREGVFVVNSYVVYFVCYWYFSSHCSFGWVWGCFWVFLFQLVGVLCVFVINKPRINANLFRSPNRVFLRRSAQGANRTLLFASLLENAGERFY